MSGPGTALMELDLLCTNSEGAERSRETLVLRKPEPSDGALICKPLIGFVVGEECRQAGSDLGLQLTEGGTECLKVLIAGEHGQEPNASSLSPASPAPHLLPQTHQMR